MRKSQGITLAAAVLIIGGLALRWFYRDYARSESSVSARVWPASPALERTPGPSVTDSLPHGRKVSDAAASTDRVASERIATEAGFQNLVDTANLTKTITIAKTTQLLRAEDQKRIAALFVKTLKDMGQSDNDRRERLVYIANELQSDELLPFWQNIAARTPARFENETKYLEYGEPTEELHSIHLEMMNSIRNIGLIAARDEGAAQFLQQLILHPSSPLHDDFIRERAFISLKEADLSASIRVMKSLKPQDPLRQRLLRP